MCPTVCALNSTSSPIPHVASRAPTPVVAFPHIAAPYDGKLEAKGMPRFIATVLVVEDDQDILLLAREVLAANNYCTVTACDGATALSVLTSIKVDLILLDLIMPHMNGWEFLAARRSHPDFASIPVIVFSGYGTHPPECVDVLPKPFSSDHLLELVQRHAAAAAA